MAKLQNTLVIFGAITAAALVVPGLLGPLALQEAQAQRQAIDSVQRAVGGLVAANVGVNANVAVDVSDNQVAACVIVEDCRPRN